MKEILIILACVPLYIINSFCDKYASMQTTGSDSTKYNTLKFLTGSILLFPLFLLDSAPKFKFGAVFCGIACGILYAISKTIILKGYEKTSVSFMTLCHSAGMIIPCILGHFIWSEKMSIIAIFGVLLTIVSIVLLKNGQKGSGKMQLSGILIGLVVFLTSGGVMVLQKWMGKSFAGESVSAYNFYSFVVAALILFLLTSTKRREGTKPLPLKKILPFAAGSAISLCVISVVMTMLAGSVPSVILFPLFNGSGIILVCIGSVFVFKEKMSKKQIIGLIIGVLGLCITNIK